MPQVANVALQSAFSFDILSGEDVVWSVLMRRSWAPSKISQIVFYDISLNLYIYPETNEVCNKSQTPNKVSLIISSQKHAHCEHFPSLPFLLFNIILPVGSARKNRLFCSKFCSSTLNLLEYCLVYINNNYSPKWRWLVVDIFNELRSEGKAFCSQLTRVWRRSLGGTGGESVNSAGYSLIE